MNVIEHAGAATVGDAASVGRRHGDSARAEVDVASALRQRGVSLVFESHVFRLGFERRSAAATAAATAEQRLLRLSPAVDHSFQVFLVPFVISVAGAKFGVGKVILHTLGLTPGGEREFRIRESW